MHKIKTLLFSLTKFFIMTNLTAQNYRKATETNGLKRAGKPMVFQLKKPVEILLHFQKN